LNKLNLLPIRQALFALIAICAFTACSTEPDLLGLNLTPQGDKLNAFFNDTTTVIAFNVPIDTLRTSVLPGYTGTNFTTILCGAIYDSAYGKTEASFATQLWLSAVKPTFNAHPVADSVVLQLPYAGLYGDSLSAQTLNIYELTQSLRGDVSYYNNQYITPDPSSLLLSTTFVPKASLKDSVTLNAVKYPPMLRVKLNNAFGNKILTGGTNLDTEEQFRAYIKGLYVTATPKDVMGQGSVITFDLTGANARIQIFYHTDTDTSSLSVYVNGSSSQRYNTYNFHDYQFANPLFKAQFLSKDSTKGKQKLFLSGMSSSDIKISFPYLLKYKAQQRAGFNQAFLVIDAAYATKNNYPPSQLSLYKVYKDGVKYAVEDLSSTAPAAIAGTLDTITKQYRFQITQYLQNILKTGKEDYYLMLTTLSPGREASQLVIPGTMAGKKRLRLELIYTTQK
jgi:hypothetical protein